jgi:hypothetical protein
MEIYMTVTYNVYETYGPINIDLEDYPQLKGKTDEEIVEYFNEIKYEQNIKNGEEETLVDEFRFNSEMIKQKYTNEEEEIFKY